MTRLEAIFSSLVGGKALRHRVLELIAEASLLAAGSKVDINIMTFSFTDPHIADELLRCARNSNVTVRVIADWNQRGLSGKQQVGRLAESSLPNLNVRYKKDQPYVYDPMAAHMRWSYLASRGLLHHKTLSIIVDGEPWRLACGSFNWTAKAAESYENLFICTDESSASRELMSRVEIEFETLWCDGMASLLPEDAEAHYYAIAEAYRRNAATSPWTVEGLLSGRGDTLRILNPKYYELNYSTESLTTVSAEALIAFSSRLPHERDAGSGYAEINSRRQMILRSPSGKTKRVRLTITALALDMIFRAQPGETLLVAMYGLSVRVPEYGALLNAARRGVALRILLDQEVGKRTAASLSHVCEQEHLPIHVKSGNRMMHQKYMVNTDTATVLNGTANMSTDASTRHSEHRIRLLRHPELAHQFATDFETIWNRVSKQYTADR